MGYKELPFVLKKKRGDNIYGGLLSPSGRIRKIQSTREGLWQSDRVGGL